MILRFFLALLFATIIVGCATITRGTSDAWVARSNPTGAKVTLSNGLICVTPCALLLKRKHGFTAVIEKEGYETITATIVPKQSGAGSAGMAGNVFLGGLIGAGVDAGSGAMKDLTPNPLEVTLIPASAGMDAQSQGANFGTPRQRQLPVSDEYSDKKHYEDGVDDLDKVFVVMPP